MTTFAIGNLSYVEVGDRFVTLCGLMVTTDPSEVVLTLDEARRLHEALGFAILHEAQRTTRGVADETEQTNGLNNY